MKALKLLSSILMITFFSCSGNAQEKNITTSTKKNQIEVIDFYGTHRCTTCKAIEANAKYTVETYFVDEQKKGTVIFKTINVDDAKNNAISESFEAAGTALFLNVIKNGKETHINLTDFGFAKGKDKEVFTKELKLKIENELKKL